MDVAPESDPSNHQESTVHRPAVFGSVMILLSLSAGHPQRAQRVIRDVVEDDEIHRPLRFRRAVAVRSRIGSYLQENISSIERSKPFVIDQKPYATAGTRR
ncbi:hypothetical protein EN852_006415 [Mesorhizobium sp. M2E.F.Ca.ET.209.01.1.1]|uniref:hypothetical protein n=1 Tax=Mesorhizobium sp. M2E.F.Ca.ET.209.01.1.1 TaxID=2500526 RepID=UPI000FD8D2C0|nr:hypothetical protein [Mesorhizobium sp. M2E.F.Ca.ET.209.01.1.1]TGS16840.1 hypothetical protein EN852_006415 [Mesorhizobium sp. M2E.F.Ca.ET.209.01.1.1]